LNLHGFYSNRPSTCRGYQLRHIRITATSILNKCDFFLAFKTDLAIDEVFASLTSLC
jgi:hypothetical protein